MTNNFLKSNWKVVASLIGGIAIGFCVTIVTGHTSNLMSEDSVRVSQKNSLISPLLICGASEPKDFGVYKSLQHTLNQSINTAISSGDATDVAVYFRDFKGKWVGMNENEIFVPASLMKVPLMIAYLKEAENNPTILNQKLSLSNIDDLNKGETFKSSHDLQPGIYTVDSLIGAMIIQSDNNAMALLLQNIDTHYLAEVYTDLGLQVPGSDGAQVNFITPKQYSYFFRILYNATYLNEEYSQKALELLSQSEFIEGLRSVIPAPTIIAQKFGERTQYDISGQVESRELHDCGIVYAKEKPYFLCVMTKGTDFAALKQVIASIAQAVQTDISTAQ